MFNLFDTKMWQFIVKIIPIIVTVTDAIRIASLEVPSKALAGDEVRLRCDYEMDGATNLYSLKWYKDGKEFYRHVPGNGQSPSQRCPIQASVPGVTIDCWPSSEREVVLKGVTRKTSGEYRCEVIGDHPAFRREERKARLTVYSEPLKDPIILGAVREYALGSKVSLNCTSNNVEYLPTLSWFINQKPASDNEISYPYLSNKRSLGLDFIADETRFIDSRVQVTCQAKIGTFHVQSASKTLYIPGLVRAQYFSKGSRDMTDKLITFIMLYLLAALN